MNDWQHSVASAGLHGNTGRALSRQVQQRTASNSPALKRQLILSATWKKLADNAESVQQRFHAF